jgi:hypothetical protein
MTMSQMDQDTEYRIRESQASFARRVEDLERADRQARAARWRPGSSSYATTSASSEPPFASPTKGEGRTSPSPTATDESG